MAVIRKQYKDFDAMFSQMESDTIPFRIFGKEYQIKKEIPAFIVLQLARLEEQHEISNAFLYRAADHIFGPEILNELTKNPNFSADMLNEMVRWAFRAINGEERPDSGELTEDDSVTEQEKN